MGTTILETKELARVFGGIVALNSLDLILETGKINAIIGPNGAGKTTLFNVIAGVYPPTRGEIYFKGVSLSGKSSHDRATMGIARTFQNVLLFGNMTALENVMSGQHVQSRYGFFEAALRLPKAHREEESIELKATKYLNLVGLGTHSQENALSMPLGQQKLLAIARALATEPQLLLLDEPGAGLNAFEKQALGELIRRLRDMGISILLVEHDMDLVMGIAEWIVVLDSGQKIAEGTAREIQKNQRVIAAYLGEETD